MNKYIKRMWGVLIVTVLVAVPVGGVSAQTGSVLDQDSISTLRRLSNELSSLSTYILNSNHFSQPNTSTGSSITATLTNTHREIISSANLVRGVFQINYRVSASGGDVFVPASCTSNSSSLQKNGAYYTLINPNPAIFGSTCTLSSTAERVGNNSLYKVRAGQTKDFTLTVTVTNSNNNFTNGAQGNVSVLLNKINWGRTLNIHSPQTTASLTYIPSGLITSPMYVPYTLNSPLLIDLVTIPTNVYPEGNFDVVWGVGGSDFNTCVATGDKVRIVEGRNGFVLNPNNNFRELVVANRNYWSNLVNLPASGAIRLQAKSVDPVDLRSPINIGLECTNLSGDRVTANKTVGLIYELMSNDPVTPPVVGPTRSPVSPVSPVSPSISNVSISGSSLSSDLWYINEEITVTWDSNNLGNSKIDILLCYISNNRDICVPQKTNISNNGQTTTRLYPMGRLLDKVHHLKVKSRDNEAVSSRTTSFGIRASREAISNISIAGLSNNTWGHREIKTVSWSSVGLDGVNVDIILCNGNPTCWPLKMNTPNDGREEVSMWSSDKPLRDDYYLKIRKLNTERVKGISNTFTTGVNLTSFNWENQVASVFLGIDEVLSNIGEFLRK